MGAAGVCSPVSFPVSLILGGVWLSYSCSLFFPRTGTAPTTQAWAALRPAAAAASASRTRGLCQEDLPAVLNPLTKLPCRLLATALGASPAAGTEASSCCAQLRWTHCKREGLCFCKPQPSLLSHGHLFLSQEAFFSSLLCHLSWFRTLSDFLGFLFS